MHILGAYEEILHRAPAVSLNTHIGRVAQNAPPPNILLELIEQGGDYSHSGPVGLYDAHIRVTCRADTVFAAAQLGDAVVRRLQDFVGSANSCKIQMTEHFNTSSDFQDGVNVFRHISEYTAFFTRTGS